MSMNKPGRGKSSKPVTRLNETYEKEETISPCEEFTVDRRH